MLLIYIRVQPDTNTVDLMNQETKYRDAHEGFSIVFSQWGVGVKIE